MAYNTATSHETLLGQQQYYQQQQPQQPQYYQPQPQFNSQPPPPKYPLPPPNPPQFAVRRRFNDLWATILFGVVLAAFAYTAYLGVPKTIDSIQSGGNFQFSQSTGSATNRSQSTLGLSTKDVGSLIGASVGIGAVFSIVYYFLMLKFPGPLIKLSYWVNAALLFVAAALAGYARIYVACIIYALFGALVIWTYFIIRYRIPFSEIILSTVCKITGRLNGVLFVALGGLVVAAAFATLWVLTVVGMAEYLGQKGVSNAVMIVTLVFLVFVCFWFNEVVRNTVHVTICGSFATYLFLGIQQPNSTEVTLPTNRTTLQSLSRALTTSFGSVCFGSLLVSLIRTLKFLAQIAKNDAAQDGNIFCCLVAACMECILQCLADILDFFNKYAYTEVAIYGKPYCDAGRDTWNLIKYKGIDLIINDSMIGNVLGMGSLFCALLCAFAGFLYVHTNNGLGTLGNGAGLYVGVCLGCAFLGGWLFLVLLEAVDSGQSCLFVCIAEDPATIQRQLPALFDAIQSRFPSISWGMQTVAY